MHRELCSKSFLPPLYNLSFPSLIKIGLYHVLLGQGSKIRQGIDKQLVVYMVTMCQNPIFQVIKQSALSGGILSEKTDFCKHLRYQERAVRLMVGSLSHYIKPHGLSSLWQLYIWPLYLHKGEAFSSLSLIPALSEAFLPLLIYHLSSPLKEEKTKNLTISQNWTIFFWSQIWQCDQEIFGRGGKSSWYFLLLHR